MGFLEGQDIAFVYFNFFLYCKLKFIYTKRLKNYLPERWSRGKTVASVQPELQTTWVSG